MDIPALLAAVASLKELASAFIGERDARKLAAIQHDFTERITEVQLKLSEAACVLVERSALTQALQDRVRDLEHKEVLRDRYELAELVTGVFAYRLKASAQIDQGIHEPSHFICQPCLDARGIKSVLSRAKIDRRWHLRCYGPQCGFVAEEE